MSLINYPDLPPIVLPAQFTVSLEQFSQWTHSPEFPEQGEISFIAGEVIINMSPERAETHNFIKLEIGTVLGSLVRQLNTGRFFTDGMRVVNSSASLSSEPDSSYISWESLTKQKVSLTGDIPRQNTEIVGSPDWVLEIVSPSSVRKDKKLLPEQYFAAGIPEYWLIDALGDEIEFTLFTAGENGYVRSEQKDGWAYSPVFDREFQLTRQHDQIGLWQYTLAMRESNHGA